MGQLFAKKHKAEPPPNVDQDDMALLDLKTHRDKLQQSSRKLEQRASKSHEVARTLVAEGKKTQAMLALRRWEQQKRLGEDCQNHIARLQELIASIEMAQLTKGTVDALKTGVAMMKRIQQDIGGVDQVQRLLGEQEEVQEAQQEIAAMLAGEGGVEDAEMLSEFSRLQEEAALSTLTKADAEAPATTETLAPDTVPVEETPQPVSEDKVELVEKATVSGTRAATPALVPA
ncbi:unnamed protein product [Cladocopium goreaui]|uniref:Charged multivesicular body protein 6 n=1 Tax=Cladocopium goreaui TaxID=2562237 RepID=A0A9P1M5Z5_9DINO|nr:unnamed protein product [Cladocopium goreaui]|mmetsp:Transcript_34054/g.73681  ORF Transcript_34054/g.73681 Transcript_34054/m.73681 type:complete len:231 (-) Transcript_34054:46-738(-)